MALSTSEKNALPRGIWKEVSAMAWITDKQGRVLMVRQTRGRRLWALPGGKVRARESLAGALRREVKEETGLVVTSLKAIDYFDRHQKGNLTVLFRVKVRSFSALTAGSAEEIIASGFQKRRPAKCTPSAVFFWKKNRGVRKN